MKYYIMMSRDSEELEYRDDDNNIVYFDSKEECDTMCGLLAVDFEFDGVELNSIEVTP